MLFNAYDFLLAFLPVTLLGHGFLVRRDPRKAAVWLVLCSLFFYGHWYPPYLLLLLGSVGFNWVMGGRVAPGAADEGVRYRRLTAGVVANLGLLGWFKYAGFLAWNVSAVTGLELAITVALPLAISFFTFQQIAYLVDAYRGLTHDHDVLDYLLFVSFFPQLIAGPIVHHAEMLEQFGAGRVPTDEDRAVGWTIFTLGLAKKVLIADGLAAWADAGFDGVAAGHELTVMAAWTSTFAYTFQLYFDFSGYSDMAIGLARLFGIRLPANFEAPYRAPNIIEFWRRWHMTLSRFLRDYLYFPLGGNRRGKAARYRNLMITMVLGGLWHGAGWTFVIWGGLHGSYLMINHGWRAVRGGGGGRLETLAGRALTLAAVVFGWVFFRAASVGDALTVLRGMAGLDGIAFGSPAPVILGGLLVCLAITQWAPTSQAFMSRYRPVLESDHLVAPRWAWSPTVGWALVTGFVALICVPVLERADAFLYWQF